MRVVTWPDKQNNRVVIWLNNQKDTESDDMPPPQKKNKTEEVIMCPDKQEGRMRERHRKQCCGHTRTNKKESNEE